MEIDQLKMNERKRDFSERDHFGNFESNLHFLSETDLISNEKKIIEIGSGAGHILNHFYSQEYDICGIEIDRNRIEESKRLYDQLPFILVSPSSKLPFDDKYFDIVMSFDVLEHIPDTDSHLEDVRRILKNNGFYILTTPNKWTNTLFETIRWRSYTKWREDHCSLHTRNELKKRFKRHGFETEFYDIPIVNDFFKKKLRTFLGEFGILLLKIMNPDKLPHYFKTNIFIKAKKIN